MSGQSLLQNTDKAGDRVIGTRTMLRMSALSAAMLSDAKLGLLSIAFNPAVLAMARRIDGHVKRAMAMDQRALPDLHLEFVSRRMRRT